MMVNSFFKPTKLYKFNNAEYSLNSGAKNEEYNIFIEKTKDEKLRLVYKSISSNESPMSYFPVEERGHYYFSTGKNANVAFFVNKKKKMIQLIVIMSKDNNESYILTNEGVTTCDIWGWMYTIEKLIDNKNFNVVPGEKKKTRSAITYHTVVNNS